MRSLDLGITSRLAHRIRADFGDAADRVMLLPGDVQSGNQDRERVLAAVVLGARGDLQQLGQLIDLSRLDWRDALVSGGLATGDWPRVMNDRLREPG